tara:strand:- start:535 stop:3324 length:2790 start_codon:yes stop_codon:yes gene_type:complete
MSLRLPSINLPATERSRFLYALLGFMCVASSALIARSAGDTLFLTRFSLDYLSYMYVGTAIVVICASYTYGTFASRIPLGRLIIRTCILLILLLVALRLALFQPWGGYRILAYFLSDLVVNVPMMLFWSFAAMLFNPREAKRLFGFIGAGGTCACIGAGFLVRPFAAQFGTENLLLLIGVLVAGFALLVFKLSKLEANRLQPTPGQGSSAPRTNHSGLVKMPQVRNLVLLIIVATSTLTLVDYQFKVGARANYSGSELAGFFGTFYAYASVIALVFQLFLVHSILKRGGVFLGLAILPAGMVAVSLGTAITGEFSWIVGSKLLVQILLFTVDMAAMQMLYLGIQQQSRNQARAFVEGIGKPLAIAATGGTLAALGNQIQLQYLAGICVVAALIWLVLSRTNFKSYVSALVGSLGSRRFDPTQETAQFQDKSFETHLRDSLSSSSDEEIIYLLGIIEGLDHADWTAEFRSLLGRKTPEIRIASLEYLQEHGNDGDLKTILGLRTDPDPRVRAAAIYTTARLGDQETTEEIEKDLADPDPTARGAAVAALINSGDLDNLLNAGVVLKGMLKSQDSEIRIAAADSLAHVQSDGLFRPLIGLLQDEDPRVIQTALEACSKRPDDRMIPVIIPLLAEPVVSAAAAETLVRFGDRILDHLLPYLELHRLDGSFPGADRVPAILAKLGNMNAIPSLVQASSQIHDPNVQRESVRAYSQLLKTAPAIKPYLEDLNRVVDRQLQSAARQQELLETLQQMEGTEILCDALKQEYDVNLQGVFTLLDVCIPSVDMEALYRELGSRQKENRANILEILDNVLKGEIKNSLLKLLESAKQSAPDPEGSTDRHVTEILERGAADWVAIGALYTASHNGLRAATEFMPKYLSHTNPVVRETALFSWANLDRSDAFEQTCQELLKDPHESVSELAKSLIHEHPSE